MSKDKRFSNRELLGAIKHFLAMVYQDESGNFLWKVREIKSKSDKSFNSKLANKLACNATSGRISYNNKLICFGINTIKYVMIHGKLPLGNDDNKLSIYPNTEEGLTVYNEFLKLVWYSDNSKCFYWKQRKECDKHDKRFNTLHARKKIKYGSRASTNAAIGDGFYSINLLHALWLLKKGVPSKLRLYMLDKDKGLCIDNISDE